MDELLSVSSTKRFSHVNVSKDSAPTNEKKPALLEKVVAQQQFTSSQDVLKALQSKPSFEVLQSCLTWLVPSQGGFNIKIPGPKATQIISTLVNEIIPVYWPLINTSKAQHARERKLLAQCLSSIAGLGALCARLRMLLDARSESADTKSRIPSENIQGDILDVLGVLNQILRGKGTLEYLWQEIDVSVPRPVQRHLLTKELVSLLASGKIQSLAAEALHVCGISRGEDSLLNWLGEERLYCSWLGNNVTHLVKNAPEENVEAYKLGASLLNRGFFLGYNGKLERLPSSHPLTFDRSTRRGCFLRCRERKGKPCHCRSPSL